MEKSIESIWKEGFLNKDALVAPKLNDLYSQKSIHLIDKFKRMFRVNLLAIVAGGIVFLGLSFLVKIPVAGIGFSLMLPVIVVVNKRLAKGLDKIDTSESSYHYIKAFDSWLKELLKANRRLARVYYPWFFLSTVAGFWYANFYGQPLGKEFTEKLLLSYPDIYLVFGVPVVVILAVVLIMALLAYFGGRIYNWDFKVIYGGIMEKLNEMIADMEELRK